MSSTAVLRRAARIVFPVICVLAIAVAASAQGPQFVTFDGPGASSYGTVPADMNIAGTITGYYWDANYVAHGFVRNADGKITSFDAPGAGTVANDYNGTFAAGINQFGVVAGYINDANDVSYGFIRTPDGKFKFFSEPNADTNPADAGGTVITGINDLGAMAGYYFDTTPSHMIHGFFLSPEGQFTSFDPPGSIETVTDGPLNLEGAIVGWYLDANNLYHAMERYPNGTIKTWVLPGACTTGTQTGCYGQGDYNINVFGVSVGAYMDNSGNFVGTGFLRTANGSITTFTIPGAGNGSNQGFTWNQIASINDWGAVTAGYFDSNYVNHGFLRTPNGKFSSFDAPGADLTPGDYNGTFPVSLNDAGVIMGYYVDSNYVQHGFVRIP